MFQKTIVSLANEVLRQCSSNTACLPLDLCVYLLDLKLLQLSKDISTVARDANLTETLVKKCVKDLKENSLSINTLKLQLHWKKKYQPRDEVKKIHHERVFKNVLPLMSEITEESSTKALDKDRLCKKIAIFIIMFAGLGSPSQQSVIKETQAALHSIFKATEVENFLSLSKATKEQQLIEFAHLITGIMLFTKDCKKGGEGMDDLPLILTEGVRATKERLINFKDQLDQKIEKLIYILQQGCSKYQRNNEPDKISLTKDFQHEKFEEFKSWLIYYRQIEYFLNDLIKDLEKSYVIIEELVQRLQVTLLQVHGVVRYRVAVATVQVFPLFLQLSNVWVEMQEEVDILSEINNNFEDLSLSSKLEPTLPMPLEVPLPNESTLLPETVEIRECLDFSSGIKICSISSVSTFDHFQYKGFCAWTLAYTEGLLINGNVKIGVIQFSNRFYTFSTAEAAHKWALNPNYHINNVLQVARARPELIKFLGLEDDLLEKLPVEEDEKPSTQDAQIQTDLHPQESLIDREYTFSEWELKRRLMKLATLTRCATKSQQTTMQSCFRTETAVQATPCKHTSTQTAKDGFCNHPAVPRYAWRLRTKLQDEGEFLVPDSEPDVIKTVKN